MTSIVKSRALNSANREHEYPASNMPFYLYGTPNQMHISHMLLRAPNISLSAGNVTLSPPLESTITSQLPKGLILTLEEIPEAAMQPFPTTIKDLSHFFFRNKEEFKVKIYKDSRGSQENGPGLLNDLGNSEWQGKMKLNRDVDVDAEWPNKDEFANNVVDSGHWQEELAKIGNVLNSKYKDGQ